MLTVIIVLLVVAGFITYYHSFVNNKKVCVTGLHEALLELKKGNIPYDHVGICTNLELGFGILSDQELRELFREWGGCYKVSSMEKDVTYPVGGKEEYKREQQSNTFWQNPRRLELLDYLIERTKL